MTAASNNDGPARKKRGADRQITKDDEDEEPDDNDSGDAPPSGSFARASADILSQRRIVKIKRPAESCSNGDKPKASTNPFAINLASGVGSTFGGFGSSSSGFGFASSSTGSSGFSAFSAAAGASSTTSGFGGARGGSSIFGGNDSKTEESQFGFATSAASTDAAAPVLPEDVEVTNGEEGAEQVFEMRVKSYELVAADDEKQKETTEQQKPSTPAGTPLSSTTRKETMEKEDVEKNVSKKDDEKDETTDEASISMKKLDNSKEEVKQTEDKKEAEKEEEDKKEETKNEMTSSKRWRELGIGPLRVLKKDDSTRVVQRREQLPGSMGTKVILNTLLKKESQLSQPSEKHVQLMTVGAEGEAQSFLFKVRSVQDAVKLHGILKSEIETASSAVRR